MDLLLFKQLLCAIIKLFSYNELDFQLAVAPTVEAAVLEEPVLATSCLFSDDWYAWQDSNLRPVAPEATALSI